MEQHKRFFALNSTALDIERNLSPTVHHRVDGAGIIGCTAMTWVLWYIKMRPSTVIAVQKIRGSNIQLLT